MAKHKQGRKASAKHGLLKRGLVERSPKGGLRLSRTGRNALRARFGVSDRQLSAARTELERFARVFGSKYIFGGPGGLQLLESYAPTLAALKHFTPKLGGKQILEAGYGGPLFLQVLQKLGVKTTGCQLYVDKRLPGSVKKNLNLQESVDIKKLPYKPGSFDAVVCKDVLMLGGAFEANYTSREERSAAFELAIQNLQKTLKKGGLLVVQSLHDPGLLKKQMLERNCLKVHFKGFVSSGPELKAESGLRFNYFLLIASKK